MSGLKREVEISQRETEDRSMQLKETMEKLKTVRGTLQDATEVNTYKARELKEKVKIFYIETKLNIRRHVFKIRNSLFFIFTYQI